jgi:hypothetical protein
LLINRNVSIYAPHQERDILRLSIYYFWIFIYLFRLGCPVILQHCQLLDMAYLKYLRRALLHWGLSSNRRWLCMQFVLEKVAVEMWFCFPSSSHCFCIFIYHESLKFTNSLDQAMHCGTWLVTAGKSKLICVSINNIM